MGVNDSPSNEETMNDTEIVVNPPEVELQKNKSVPKISIKYLIKSYPTMFQRMSTQFQIHIYLFLYFKIMPIFVGIAAMRWLIDKHDK